MGLVLLASCAPALPQVPSEATLLLAEGSDDGFGAALALSADGTRALIGAPSDDTAGGVDSGSARVFVREGGAWVEEGVLLPADRELHRGFGEAVALSADGTHALVSAGFIRDTTAPSVHAFVRSGTTWSQEASLVRTDGGSDAGFGGSLALSADGTRALIGATGDLGIDLAGSVRVYVRSGASWSLESTLHAPAGEIDFGSAVALSADGTRALIGGAGVAYVLALTGTAWSDEATLEPPSSSEAHRGFGESVALSADGARAVVGAGRYYRENAVAYAREGASWSLEPTYPAWVSGELALSADGTRAVAVTGLAADITVFARGDAGWSEWATLAADGPGAVALSGDGTRALVGTSGRVEVFTLAP